MRVFLAAITTDLKVKVVPIGDVNVLLSISFSNHMIEFMNTFVRCSGGAVSLSDTNLSHLSRQNRDVRTSNRKFIWSPTQWKIRGSHWTSWIYSASSLQLSYSYVSYTTLLTYIRSSIYSSRWSCRRLVNHLLSPVAFTTVALALGFCFCFTITGYETNGRMAPISRAYYRQQASDPFEDHNARLLRR